MKANYRTSVESWGIMDLPHILVEEIDQCFRLTGYRKQSEIDLNRPCAGVSDVLEFEIHYDED